MTDQQEPETPEVEFIDLDAVDLIVETTLYGEECDEVDVFEIAAGQQPFILLTMSQKEGENTLAYQFLGSLINTEADLLESLEVFADALRAKIEADESDEDESDERDDYNEPYPERDL